MVCTVKHILLECRAFAITRKHYFEVNNIKDLFKNVHMDEFLSFLRERQTYTKNIDLGTVLKIQPINQPSVNKLLLNGYS